MNVLGKSGEKVVGEASGQIAKEIVGAAEPLLGILKGLLVRQGNEAAKSVSPVLAAAGAAAAKPG